MFLLLLSGSVSATEPWKDLDAQISQVLPGVIELRHAIHQQPELGNREFHTSERIAQRLRELGLEVQTGIAHTGVIAVSLSRECQRSPPVPGSAARLP